MSLLNVENIRKSYGKTEVLKDISFSLKKGRGACDYRLIGFGQDYAVKVS